MATGLIRPDTLHAWAGQSLLIVNTHGECGADQRLTGYYFREARFLRTLQLRINGRAPWRCEATAVQPDTLLFTYVYPEVIGKRPQSAGEEPTDADGMPQRALDVRMRLTVDPAHLDVEIRILNRATTTLAFDVAWILGADFADIQEAEAGRRQQRAPVKASMTRDHQVQFAYGHPKLRFRTRVRHFDARRWRFIGRRLSTHLELPPRAHASIALRILPSGTTGDLAGDAAEARRIELERWRASFTQIAVPGNTFAEHAIALNVRDVGSLPLLDGERDEWLTLAAGIPLYPTLFGRDALTAGWQTAMVDCGQAVSTALVRLGKTQSHWFDDEHDAEPGRLLYQMRTGPLELLDKNPDAAYYADFAGPFMFVIALANLYAWTGDASVVRRHWDTARRILDWARELGDRDHDGYLEYLTKSPRGTKNQGWKDSDDAIIYADGSRVPDPVGTCELQAYWYSAQWLMAALAWMVGERADADALRRSAVDLKARFNKDWWVPSQQFFALAMDPRKHLVEAVSSNVGHCLAAGIIDSDHLRPVVDRLFAPDLFSGWGIRTLSSNHAFYNPLTYHRGSVWAVEQSTILFGLRRFGFTSRAHDLARALFDLARLYPDHRIPECVGGYARDDGSTPGAYPHANAPQLWNAAAFPLTMQTLLGLTPLAPFETLVIDPQLPSWLPDVEVRRLRVGQASVSLRFWRDEQGQSHWEVLEKHGTLHIVRQPPPEAVDAGLVERTADLIESVRRAAS